MLYKPRGAFSALHSILYPSVFALPTTAGSSSRYEVGESNNRSPLPPIRSFSHRAPCVIVVSLHCLSVRFSHWAAASSLPATRLRRGVLRISSLCGSSSVPPTARFEPAASSRVVLGGY